MSVTKVTTPSVPWKTGYWADELSPANLTLISETGLKTFNINLVEFPPDLSPALEEKRIEYGDFGPARKEVADASGIEVYNLKWDGKNKAVLSQDGTEIHFWGPLHRVEKKTWISETTLEQMLADRDSFDSPR